MVRSLWVRVKLLSSLILLLVAVHGINILMDGNLNYYGIIPRSEPHWFHVFTSPFIHADLGHLVNNLFALTVFSAFFLLRSTRFYVLSSFFIITLTGVLVWFFGRNAVHVGASGWIFGLWSLSIAIAWFDRRPANILSAFVVLFLYGGMIYGVLPTDPKISFEAHFFGAFSGVVFAYIYSVYLKRRSKAPNRLSAQGKRDA